MSTPTDLAPSIQTAAQQPRSVTSDGLSVTAQPIADQIAADRYAAAKAARASRFGGVMMRKVISAGPMNDSQTTGFGGLRGFDQAVL